MGGSAVFGVLGPMEIDKGAVAAPTGRRRRLLTVLLTRPNENLTTEWLLDDLWAGEAPPTGRTALHVHVSHIRKLLDLVSRPVPLVTTGGAYRLEAGADTIDWLTFEDGIGRGLGAIAAGRHTAGFDCLDTALRLWRGDPFDGETDPTDRVGRLAARLTESRRAALVAWADLAIRRQGTDAVPVLVDAVQAFPYDEDLTVRLATALAASGRQPDALAEVRRCGSVLRDDLGLSPQPVLGALELAILDGEPDLVDRFVPSREVGSSASSQAGARVSGLRANLAPCVGRDEMLDELLADVGPKVFWISGPGGRGKTRLLEELAARSTDRGVRLASATREQGGAVPILRALFPERDDLDAQIGALAQGGAGPADVGVALAEAVLARPPRSEEWWLVDDAQWLRGDERAGLRRLALGIADGEVSARLVVAARGHPSEADGVGGGWAVRDLPPLTDAAVADILGERIVPPSLTEIVRGEPLLASQLATAARAAGGLAALGDPAGVLQKAADTLAGTITRDANHVVDVVAVAGTVIARVALDRVLDWPSSRLDAALASAEQAGLLSVGVQGVDIAHQTLRDPLLRRVEPPIRQRWALAISRAARAAGVPVAASGVGLPTASDGADGQAALRALLHAGREALRSLALGDAARIGSLGVELARPASREAAEARLIEAFGTTDEPGTERAALLLDAWDRARTLRAEDILTEAAIGLSGPWGPGNRVDHDAVERLRESAAVVEDPGLRARLLARLVTFRLGMLDDAAMLADGAWSAAQASGDPEAVCLAATALCYAGLGRPGTAERRDRAADALDLAERSSFYERIPGLATHLFVAASALGDADGQQRSLNAYDEVIEVTGRPVDRWHRALLGASEAMSRMDLDEAEHLSARAHALGEKAQMEDAFADRVVQQFCLALLGDDLPRLRPLAPASDGRPMAIASRLVAAVARADTDEIAVERLRAMQFLADPEPDYLWLGTLAFVDWAARHSDDHELSEQLAGLCVEFPGERAVAGMAMAVLGRLPA